MATVKRKTRKVAQRIAPDIIPFPTWRMDKDVRRVFMRLYDIRARAERRLAQTEHSMEEVSP